MQSTPTPSNLSSLTSPVSVSHWVYGDCTPTSQLNLMEAKESVQRLKIYQRRRRRRRRRRRQVAREKEDFTGMTTAWQQPGREVQSFMGLSDSMQFCTHPNFALNVLSGPSVKDLHSAPEFSSCSRHNSDSEKESSYILLGMCRLPKEADSLVKLYFCQFRTIFCRNLVSITGDDKDKGVCLSYAVWLFIVTHAYRLINLRSLFLVMQNGYQHEVLSEFLILSFAQHQQCFPLINVEERYRPIRL